MLQEESSVTKSIRYIKWDQMYPRVSWCLECIKVQRLSGNVKCIKEYWVYQGILGVSGAYQVYQIHINNKDICDILYFVYVWDGLCFFFFFAIFVFLQVSL